MRRYLSFIVVFGPALAGCHKASPLEGDWDSEITASGQPGTQHAHFGSDGHFKNTLTLGSTAAIALTAVDTGTWRLEGDKLWSHFDDVQWTFSGREPGVTRGRERFKKNRQSILDRLNKDPYQSLAWSGNDAFTLSDSKGEKETFHRVR